MSIKELFINQLPSDFSSNSKVWVFQSSRPFGKEESLQVQEQLDQFSMQWQSHGADVKSWAKLLFNNIIVVIADDDIAHVGGCSTDAMMRTLKSFERQYAINLFDRLTLLLYVKEKFERLPLHQLQYALDKQYVSVEDLYFDGSIATLAQLQTQFLQPIKNSWLMKHVEV